jgi:hypothetical protein
MDAAAMIHDVEYSYYADQSEPDKNMINNLKLYSNAVSFITNVVFKLKDLYGYKPELVNKAEYIRLRNKAIIVLNQTPYKRMKFIDQH